MAFAAFVPYIAMAAGAAVSAVGSVKAGNDKAAALKYNSLIEEQNAEAARLQAQAEAEQKSSEITRRMADTRAAYAASGIDPNSGTPLEVMSDLATQGELSKRLILYQGKLTARGYSQQANLDRGDAKSAQTAGYINAGSTLLTAAGKTAGNSYTPASSAAKPSIGSTY